MKKIFTFTLIVSFSVGLMAQSYPIPGAVQQPAWVFPFFLEDAHGNKDTLYMGYDSSSSQCYCPGDDPAFGETWFVTDTNNFYAVTYNRSGHWPNDSAQKVNIVADLRPNCFCFRIGALNAYYPVKFSWDVSLLRSDSIPFPNQNPFPRAQINVEWFLGVNSIHTTTCGDYVVISDTVLASCVCQYEDSLVIYHFFNDSNRTDCGFLINITPWTGMSLTGVTEINNLDHVIVYPNPAYDFIFIKEHQQKLNFEILDAKGIVLKKGYVSNNSEEKILVSDIAPGFYHIRIYDENKVINKKIIIQH